MSNRDCRLASADYRDRRPEMIAMRSYCRSAVWWMTIRVLTWRPANAGPLGHDYCTNTLENLIEMAELDSGDKVPPLVPREFVNRAFGVACVLDEHGVSITGHRHARSPRRYGRCASGVFPGP